MIENFSATQKARHDFLCDVARFEVDQVESRSGGSSDRHRDSRVASAHRATHRRPWTHSAHCKYASAIVTRTLHSSGANSVLSLQYFTAVSFPRFVSVSSCCSFQRFGLKWWIVPILLTGCPVYLFLYLHFYIFCIERKFFPLLIRLKNGTCILN